MSLLKKTFVLASGQLGNALLSGAFSLYATRVLGPANRGAFTLITGSCDIMASLFGFGLPFAAAYFARSRPGCLRNLLRFTYVAMLLSGALSILAILACNGIFSRIFLDGTSIDALRSLPIAGMVVVQIGVGITASILIALGDSRGSVAALLSGTAALITTGLILFQTMPDLLAAALIATATGNCVAFGVGQWRLSRTLPPAAMDVRFSEILTYGLKAWFGNLASLLFKRIDIFVIGHALSTEAVGHYSIGLTLRDLAMTISRSFSGLAGGELADPRNGSPARTQGILRAAAIFNITTALLCLGITLGTFPFLIPLVFGKAFDESVLPALIIMGSLLPMSLSLFYARALQAMNRPLLQSIGCILASAIASAVIWQFTMRWGLIGAASAAILDASLLLIISAVSYAWANRNRETAIDSRNREQT